MPPTDKQNRIVTKATIENLFDLYEVRDGVRETDSVRRVSDFEAEVDVQSLTVGLPHDLISRLDLRQSGQCGTTPYFGPIRLTIQSRVCHVDVIEQTVGEMPIIGHAPLTLLDLVVDPLGQKLIGNPAHGGEQMLESY